MNAATPGTVLVLAAAILLAVATASVPVNDSIYFLVITTTRARLKLGCLGFCVGNNCSSTTIGYKLTDAAQVFGVNTNIPYANTLSSGLIHGLTYALVLHPVACGLAGVAFLLGILQHCTGFATGWLTTIVTGLATTVALVATALDFALFTIAKKRVESAGGSASYGIAIWLTLAAFIVLVCSQCAFCCSCCSSGGIGGRRRKKNKNVDDDLPSHNNAYGQQMRMDAIQAENDRLRRKENGGRGDDLPRFAEYETEHTVPLKNDYDDHNGVHHAVGQAYGGGAYDQHPQNQYHSSAPASSAGYVPGVGPAYGNGHASHNANRDSVPYNNVGGFGAHGSGLDQPYDPHAQSQYDTGYNQEAYDPPHHHQQHSDYYAAAAGGAALGGAAAAGAAAASGGHRSRQPTVDDYQSTPYRSTSTGPHGARNYAPSVTSGYAQGEPGPLAMPVPQTASPADALGRSASVAPSEASRDDRRLPTQHDEFGLGALQASAAAAALGGGGGGGSSQLDEKQRLQRHYAEQDQQQQQQQQQQQPSSSAGEHWQEPSGMYYDAEEPQQSQQAGPSSSAQQAGVAYGGGNSDAHHEDGRWTSHSQYSRGHGPGGSDWVPSYEMAIGAISQDEENLRRQQRGQGARSNNATPAPAPSLPLSPTEAGPSQGASSSAAAGRRPLPSTPGAAPTAHPHDLSSYPREKY